MEVKTRPLEFSTNTNKKKSLSCHADLSKVKAIYNIYNTQRVAQEFGTDNINDVLQAAEVELSVQKRSYAADR